MFDSISEVAPLMFAKQREEELIREAERERLARAARQQTSLFRRLRRATRIENN